MVVGARLRICFNFCFAYAYADERGLTQIRQRYLASCPHNFDPGDKLAMLLVNVALLIGYGRIHAQSMFSQLLGHCSRESAVNHIEDSGNQGRRSRMLGGFMRGNSPCQTYDIAWLIILCTYSSKSFHVFGRIDPQSMLRAGPDGGRRTAKTSWKHGRYSNRCIRNAH